MRWVALFAAALTFAAGAAPAAAALPRQGTLVPGRSLGGVRLGEPAALVRATLGFRGVCRGCPHTTWYFTYAPFDRHGLGVEISGGRVSAVYTLWKPDGWHAADGLALGAYPAQLTAREGTMPTIACGGYTAYYRDSGRARTVYYLSEGRVWAFGLFRRGADPCR